MPQKAKKKGTRKSPVNTPLLIGGAVVAILVVVLLIWANTTQTTSAIPAPISNAAGRTWGKADAPVTIDEYADFQCPVCGQAENTLRQVAPKYFDTGKAKVVFHNFAFIGQESTWAAEAALCASDQSKFWDYAAYLYSHQAGENAGAFSKDNLKGFAKTLSLDTNAFNTCLDSDKYQATVQQEKTQGDNLGIQATPTFFINGQKAFEGNPGVDTLSRMIDSLQK